MSGSEPEADFRTGHRTSGLSAILPEKARSVTASNAPLEPRL